MFLNFIYLSKELHEYSPVSTSADGPFYEDHQASMYFSQPKLLAAGELPADSARASVQGSDSGPDHWLHRLLLPEQPQARRDRLLGSGKSGAGKRV